MPATAPSHLVELSARRTRPALAATSLVGVPLMLTVAEAAEILRISRTSAYKLAEEWSYTHGGSGLPTVRLGGRLLVRRVDLAVIVGVDDAG